MELHSRSVLEQTAEYYTEHGLWSVSGPSLRLSPVLNTRNAKAIYF